MMTKIVKWGILSTAGIAQSELIPAFKRAENAEVVAISSLSGRAQEVSEIFEIAKAYDSYHEVLEDEEIEAVYIPLPNHLHKEWVLKAIEHKKHVLVEKPAALTASDVQDIIKRAKEEDVTVMEGFMYYFHPQHQKVKALIQAGTIGEVKHFEGAFSFHLSDRDANIRMDQDLGGGSLYDVGCYAIHAMRFIYGEEPETVRTEAIVDEKTGVDTTTVSYFTFKSGKTATITSSFDFSFRNEYRVFGTTGSIDVPKAFRPDVSGGEGQVILKTDEKTEMYTSGCDLYGDQVRHLSKSIADGQEPILTLENTYRNLQAINACLASIRSKNVEYVDKSNR